MSRNHILHNRVKFFFSGLVNNIIIINSCNRSVGRNLNNIHSVDFTELLLLRKSSTCHTGLLLKLVKEILECDCRKSPALTSDLYMLLRLNSLMKSVRETSARHYSSCKLIYDKYLIILYHIILIAEHKIMCAKCKNDIVLDLEIVKMEKLFYLSCTLFSEVNGLVLLAHNEITRLLKTCSHKDIHLGYLVVIACTLLKLSCKDIAYFIKLCRRITLSRNDKRCSRLIDKYGVNLIDNRIS